MESMTYTEAITELEKIVSQMQQPNCDIDKLAGYTSRALELLEYCRARLTKADNDIKKCLETLSPEQ